MALSPSHSLCGTACNNVRMFTPPPSLPCNLILGSPQPLVTKELILKLQTCSDLELVDVLQNTTVWRFGKVCYV